MGRNSVIRARSKQIHKKIQTAHANRLSGTRSWYDRLLENPILHQRASICILSHNMRSTQFISTLMVTVETMCWPQDEGKGEFDGSNFW